MLDQLFKASIDSVITTDTNGIITRVNPATEIMLGFSKNELIGISIRQLYMFEVEYESVLKEIDSSGYFRGVITNKTKTGHEISSFLSANKILDNDGEVIGTMGISRDISSNISLQDEHNQLINTVPDIIYSVNLGGYFTYVNETVVKILGYEPSELIGTLFTDIIYKPQRASVFTHYQNHFEKKLEQSYLEFQVIKKDGNLLWIGQQVSTKFNAIKKNRVDGFYGVVRNIDKQKKTELLLAESEAKYRDLFDMSSDLIQSIDTEGNFLYVNNSWKNVMGYSDKEVKKLNLFSLIHPDSKAHCSLLFKQIIETGVCIDERVVYELEAKNGNKIIVEGSIGIKKDNGRVLSLESFLRDVTKQKEIEKKLVEREKTLRQITETLTDVFYLYNITENKYEYISSNCDVVLGANSEFFYSGKSHTKNFVHLEDAKQLLEVNHEVSSGKPYSIDYRIIVDDKIRWINEKSYPIKDESGTVVANSGICRDITDFKSASETIKEQNNEIHKSILYAKRLQESVLPSSKRILDIFPDSFVFYKPKDIVSGDFFVVDFLRANDHTMLPSFIVGDCTGHGIPGAVLSLMCNVLVRESFTRKEVNSPSEALDFIRNRLVQFFKSDNNKKIRDGMDISFCVLDKEKELLYFAGGYNSCVIVRDKKIIEYKGDKQHVGYNENPQPFKNHVISLHKKDKIFLYTDGYIDQFGGKRGKKYTKKRLHELLVDSSDLPMTEIGEQIEKEFLDWKKELEQVDDVTLMGVHLD
jgi:PAS domain S-box-containing protein